MMFQASGKERETMGSKLCGDPLRKEEAAWIGEAEVDYFSSNASLPLVPSPSLESGGICSQRKKGLGSRWLTLPTVLQTCPTFPIYPVL